MSAVIREAEEQDLERLQGFAASSGLSMEGIHGKPDCFYLMEDSERRLMAMAGFERLGENGMLRALVLNPEKCSLDDIVRLFTMLVLEAGKLGFKFLFLVTPSPKIFESLGFVKADDVDISAQMKDTAARTPGAIIMSRKI